MWPQFIEIQTQKDESDQSDQNRNDQRRHIQNACMPTHVKKNSDAECL